MAFTSLANTKGALDLQQLRGNYGNQKELYDLLNELQTALANYQVAFTCTRQLTASVTGLFAFQMPFAATLVEVSAYARASGGTSPTLTIDVKEGGSSVLSSPISVTAGSTAVATPSDTSIADNAEITIDATIGGTTPTWDDITVVLTFKRVIEAA